MRPPIESLGYLLLRSEKDIKVFHNLRQGYGIQIHYKTNKIVKLKGNYDPVKVPLTDLERYICEGMLNE